MFYKDWKPFYEKIFNDLKLNFKKDKDAAFLLDTILSNKKIVPIKKLEKLIHECADKIVATAEHEATGHGIKPVKGARGKTTNANKMETRAGKRKSPSKEFSMTEDSPDRKRLRAEVKEAKMKQADKVNKLRMKKGLKHERKDPLDVGDICTVST